MRRRLGPRLMSVALLVAALGMPVAASEADPVVHLGDKLPDAVTPVARTHDRVPTRHDLIRVRVTRIENPGMVPFGVVVTLPGGAEIGRFSIFPADRTGDYYLSVTPDERTALLRPGAALHIALDLPTPPREGLEVELTPVFLE